MLLTSFLFGLLGLFTVVSCTPTDVISGNPDSKSNIICCEDMGQLWYNARMTRIKVGIDTLKAWEGTCAVAAGPRTCVDLTCDDDQQIQLCNDNPYPIEPNCKYLATYAEDIVAQCTISLGEGDSPYACGQQFDTDNYNIVVKESDGACDGRKKLVT